MPIDPTIPIQPQIDMLVQAATKTSADLSDAASQGWNALTVQATLLKAAQDQVSQLTSQRDTAVQSSTTAQASLVTAQKTIGQLQDQVKADQATIAGLNATIAKLTPATVPIVHDAKGQPTTVRLSPGQATSNQSFIGAIFKAAQKYALIIASNCVVNAILATSDSGGARIGDTGAMADGVTVNGLTTNGCGQNGTGYYAKNSAFNKIVSNGNNTLAYDVYNESGGGKAWLTTNCVWNDYVGKDNLGPALWFDGACIGNTTNRGSYTGSTVSGANAGKQIASYRVELSSKHTSNDEIFAAGLNQNTALAISDSSFVTFNRPTVTGQVGITDDGRKSYQGVDTSLHDIVFNQATITGNFYWPDTMIKVPTFAGTKFHLKAGQPAAYITHKGKGSTPISFDQFKAQYDPAATLTVVP